MIGSVSYMPPSERTPSPSVQAVNEPSTDDRAEKLRESLLEVARTVLMDPDLHEIADDNQLVDGFLQRMTSPDADLSAFPVDEGRKLMAAFVEAIPAECWGEVSSFFDEVRTIKLPSGISGRHDLCKQLFEGLNHFPRLEYVSVAHPLSPIVDVRGCIGAVEIEFVDTGNATQILAGDIATVYARANVDGQCELVCHDQNGNGRISLPLPIRSELPPAPLLAAGTLPPPRTITLLQTLQYQMVDAVNAGQAAKLRKCLQCVLDPDNRLTPQQRARALQLHDINGGRYSLLNWAHVTAFSVENRKMIVRPAILQTITNFIASDMGETLEEHRQSILSAQFPAAGGDPLLLRLADPVRDPKILESYEGFDQIPFNGDLMTAYLGEIISSRSLSKEEKDQLCAGVPLQHLQFDFTVAATMWAVIGRGAVTPVESQYLHQRLGVSLVDIVRGLQTMVATGTIDRPAWDAFQRLKGWNRRTKEIPVAALAKFDIGLRELNRESLRARPPALPPIEELPLRISVVRPGPRPRRVTL